MTFSFIVPVYNTEKYLAKCLDSLLAQTCSDFEIIVVNDGTPDNSQVIIDEYVARYPDKVKAFTKENGGLSDARNFGVQRASGEYFLLIDSDDYIHPDTLTQLRKEIRATRPDVIGFHLVTVNDAADVLSVIPKPVFSGLSGEDAMIALVSSKEGFEAACGFAYRTDYWKAQRFSFMTGIYHEDFALVPLVILRAAAVSCIDLQAYLYLQTDGSIMRTQTPQRIRKRAEDLLTGYDFLVSQYQLRPAQNPLAGQMYLAYAANSVINRFDMITPDLKPWFRAEVVRRRVADNLLRNTLKRKLRKLALKLKYRI